MKRTTLKNPLVCFFLGTLVLGPTLNSCNLFGDQQAQEAVEQSAYEDQGQEQEQEGVSMEDGDSPSVDDVALAEANAMDTSMLGDDTKAKPVETMAADLDQATGTQDPIVADSTAENTATPEAMPAAAPVMPAAAPVTPAAAPALPAATATMTAAADEHSHSQTFSYTIVKGDWLSKIAGRVYGDIYKWPLIANANPNIKNPNLIYPKASIKIPIIGDKAMDFAKSYGATTGSLSKGTASSQLAFSTVIKHGDSLTSLAKTHLGSASAWTKVWEQNKGHIPNPNKLEVGQTISFAG